MLIEKYLNGVNPKEQIEFKNVKRELLPWLEKIADENNCTIEKTEWKSKYNSFVVYEYEPFCSDSFDINITISSKDINHLYFLKFLYNNKLDIIDYLDSCLI